MTVIKVGMWERFIVLAGALSLSLLLTPAASANGQSSTFCGRVYTVLAGDTLSQLASRAFGDTTAFMRFYNDSRNAASLGTNPNRISIGATLYLPPCPGQGSVLAPAATNDTGHSQGHDPFNPNIDVVTATDFAPFTDEDMEFGGMLTAVVREAFDRSPADRKASIVFINDWGAHLNTLLPDQKYDFAFPWYRPDCSDPSALSAAMRPRCDLIWSSPLFSVIIGFYTLSTASNIPRDFADLRGKSLCRPAGYFTFDLEKNGLIPGQTIKLVRPNAVADCFELLEEGEVDFVTINRFTAEKAIASAGLDGLVIPIDTIVTSQDLHLVSHKSNRAAVRLTNQFNEGLAALENSGRLSSIIRYFMTIHQNDVNALRNQ